MAERIQQGTSSGAEKLYTVRPRYSQDSYEQRDKNRGSSASIRLILPSGVNKDDWRSTLKGERLRNTFDKVALVNSTDTDSTSNTLRGYIDFQVQNVAYDIQEKSQVMHTFGGQEAVYFYGQAPINVSISGMLTDDLDNDQFVRFMEMYQELLRGSRAAQDYCYIRLNLPNAQFTGAFTSVQIQQNSDRDTDVTFSAQFLAKTFVLRSTDDIFQSKDNSKIDETDGLIVRDPDPTRTQTDVSAIIAVNSSAALPYDVRKKQQEDSATTPPMSDAERAAKIDEYFANMRAKLAEKGIEVDYFEGIGGLPDLEDIAPFSAADVAEFFEEAGNFIDNVTKTIDDITSQIDGYARDAIALVNGVENGIDSYVRGIASATNQVYGAIDSIGDVISTITNFPQSLTTKLGSISFGGQETPQIAGSESISPADAIANLNSQIQVGSARGTPEGDSAVAAVTFTDANTEASLTVS